MVRILEGQMSVPMFFVSSGVVLFVVGTVIIHLAWTSNGAIWGGVVVIAGSFVGMLGILILLATVFIQAAFARDLGQWGEADPATREWFQTLMMPDAPATSCCGEADAYWCDDVHVRQGRTYCRITDDRADGPRGRPHRDVGTEVEIPDFKLKWDRGNPTGHAIVFLSKSGYVYCFVQAMGI